MIKVFVAGAYNADNVLGVLKNIGRGEAYAAELFALGFAVFCPWHDKDYAIRLYDRDIPVSQYQAHSLKWLEVCDCIFLVPGWENSAGTKTEIDRAWTLNIPIFYDTDTLCQWRKEKTLEKLNQVKFKEAENSVAAWPEWKKNLAGWVF